jgi:hypothetical protein
MYRWTTIEYHGFSDAVIEPQHGVMWEWDRGKLVGDMRFNVGYGNHWKVGYVRLRKGEEA